jgi:hypothetical protein
VADKKKAKKKDYYVYFTLHVRLRLDETGTAAKARKIFEEMSDLEAVNDGKILETEVDLVEEAP